MNRTPEDPHGAAEILALGPAPDGAAAGLLLVHGRGGSPESMLPLAAALGRSDVAIRAPRAADQTWYPLRFLALRADNQPYLDSAVELLARIVEQFIGDGLPPERLVLAGFSQGACLLAELLARHPRRYGGAALLIGGLPGADSEPLVVDGDLHGTPVFLGSPDPDSHVPWERVQASARAFGNAGAAVTLRRYPGLPHTVNDDQVRALADLVQGVVPDS